MPVFETKPFRDAREQVNNLGDRLGALYRRQVTHHPFLLFGLPFISLMVGASFLLTPATALRYEKHDRKNRQVSDMEAMRLGLRGGKDGEGQLHYNPRRRVATPSATSARDEYYRLMAKDLDNWEQKRVERFKGEPDGRL